MTIGRRSETPGRRVVAGLCALAVAAPTAFAASTALSPGAFADPPPWAPAHGYRAKKGKKRGRDYDETPVVVAPVVSTPIIDLGNCNRELVGSVIGAAAGGLLGSKIGKGSGKTIAVATGTIIGVLVGGSIGRAMDRIDQSCVGRVLEKAETGQTVAWRNPDSGGSYQVTPQKTYTTGEGRYCREYTTAATVGGRTESVYGTACRQPDGTWQIIE